MTSTEFAKLIEESKESYSPDEWWSGRCPAHDDENPSLGWRDGDAKIVIKCQAECSRDDVLAALGLTEADTWLRPRPAGAPTIAATYDYRDEAGDLLFQAVRYLKPDGKKTFSLRRRDPADPTRWANDIKGTRMVLYRLNEIQRQQRVFVVEGEKDANRLAPTGLAATTSPMGAGKWRDDYAEQLVAAGAVYVFAIPDQDEAGRKHMEQVTQSCLRAGLVVTTVELSEVVDGEERPLGPGEDVSDYLDRHTADELFDLIFRPDDAGEGGYRYTYWPEDMSRFAGAILAEMLRFSGYEGDPRDLGAMAEALASVDPKEFAPFTLPELLDAWAKGGSDLPPASEPGATAPYPNDLGDERDRPDVELSRDPKADIEAMWRVLTEANNPPRVFMYGDAAFKMQRPAATMAPLDVDRFRMHLLDLARFVVSGKDEAKPVKPDVDLLKMMLKDDERLARRVPKLRRIVRTPVFTADGRLVQRPGYDPGSEVYLVADGLAVPRVSEEPSQEEVDRARSLLLDDVFTDFPFTSQADKAAVLALTLLPFARDLIGGATPLHVIAAAKPGTGKSLMLEAVTTIALGQGVGAMAEADDEDETRKRITSQLLAEPTYVVFENLNKMMRGGAIAQALTASTWQDRILGVSKVVSLPVRCCWIAVANNPSFSDEVADRIVTCRIVSPLERPRDRNLADVKHKDLTRWVRDNRGELIWACLTLVQNWIARGRRPGQVTLGSFQAWAETMSGVLEAAGVEGLLMNRQKVLELSNPVGDSRKTFVEMWYGDFKLETKYPRDLVASADTAGCPVDSSKLNKDSSLAQSERSRMGAILNQLVDQVFTMPDGVSVTVAPGDPPRDRNGARYRLVIVRDAQPQDDYMGL